MLTRWLVASGLALLSVTGAAAQVPDEPPTELPPLLKPPTGDQNPRPPAGPRGPTGEYDHGHLYLPDYVPPAPKAPEACRPLGRWWVNPAVELAWLPSNAGARFGVGGSLAAGRFLGDEHTHSVEADAFVIGADRHNIAKFSTVFVSADANYRRNLVCGPQARLDALAGYRFGYLRDDREAVGGVGRVANTFHGGQVGLAGELRAEQWYAGGAAKVAFGSLEVNSERTEFAVLPVVNLTIGRQVHEYARIFAGYTFQYLSRAARLGDAPDPAATGFPATDFWVSSLNFGMELRY